VTAGEHGECHRQLVARRQRLRELNASEPVLERNRLQIVANSQAWNAALIGEHLTRATQAAA
jgi:hypothetical protein